jgi:hypothetical protein
LRRANPTQYDLSLAKRAIKLLVAGKALSVRLERGGDLPPGFESEWVADSNWANDTGSYYSHGGHAGYFAGLPLGGRSMRHKSFARSSTHTGLM